jgi:hypothetical protein
VYLAHITVKSSHRPSRRAVTFAGDGITVSAVLALALVAARVPVGARRTQLLTERPGPAGGTVAGPRDVVACASVATPALVFAVLR